MVSKIDITGDFYGSFMSGEGTATRSIMKSKLTSLTDDPNSAISTWIRSLFPYQGNVRVTNDGLKLDTCLKFKLVDAKTIGIVGVKVYDKIVE